MTYITWRLKNNYIHIVLPNNLESKLTPDTLGKEPKEEKILGKISYFKSHACKNENYENPSTFKTYIFRGIFENKMIVCVRRYEKASRPVQQVSLFIFKWHFLK